MFRKSHFTTRSVGTAVAGLALLVVGNASANIVLNGNFSANASSYTSYPGTSTSPNPTAPAYWSISYTANGVTGGNAGVNGPDTGFYTNPGTGNSPEPFAPTSTTGISDFLFLQGAADIPSASQTVATTAGQAYVLTYAGAARANETEDVLDVVLTNTKDNTPIATQAPAITNAGFTTFTLNFTAPSTSTEITFFNNTSNTIGGTVDVTNVSMAPVPEPAALGLVGVGTLGALLLRRRRTT